MKTIVKKKIEKIIAIVAIQIQIKKKTIIHLKSIISIVVYV